MFKKANLDVIDVALLASMSLLAGLLVGMVLCHIGKPVRTPQNGSQRVLLCDDTIHYEDGSVICEINLNPGEYK